MQIKISQDIIFHHKIGKNPKFDHTSVAKAVGNRHCCTLLVGVRIFTTQMEEI